MANPVKTYQVDEREADAAYAAYRALVRAAQTEPELSSNQYFKALQDSAYARFLLLFEALI